MDFNLLKDHKNYIIALIIFVLAIFALWVRLIPSGGLVTEAGVNLLGNDPWYNLRQIEVMVSNSLQYPWFDPMTYYPYGTDNFWGPLYPLIGALMCLIAGASTRTDIMYVSCWLPALMGALMVPLMYLIGSKVSDYKTGIVAALFTAVVAGQYLYRSLFGFVDHHIAEVLFGALFCFVFLYYLVYIRENPVDFRSSDTLKVPALIAVFCGISYTLGLANMPTMVLFALIAAIYTGLQFVWDRLKGNSTEYLVLLNLVTFIVAVIGVFIIGIHHEGMSLARYSLGHVFAYLAVIVATLGLYGLERGLKDKSFSYYLAALFGLIVAGILFMIYFVPEFFSFFISGISSFFGYSTTLTTIQEAKHWDFAGAWQAFNYGIILLVFGFIVAVYRFIKESRQTYLFIIVWSFVILYSTTVQVRYEYYLAANIALLGSLFVAWAVEYGINDILKFAGIDLSEKPAPSSEKSADSLRSKKKAENKKQPPKKKSANGLKALVAVLAIVLAVLFVYFSAGMAIATGDAMKNDGMTPDWQESLEWMSSNTPETGIDYYSVYNRNTYQNPAESYGVMSWWDYGHWITFTAKRPPNANPFQEGVAGPDGSASFFIQQNESESNAVLDHLNTRYVITDVEMDVAKFWAMATWYNTDLMQAPYQADFGQIMQDGSINPVRLNTDNYYQTMISKLHNFDGSMAEPDMVYYIEYVDGAMYGASLPVIAAAEPLSYTDAKEKADAYNANAKAGYGAVLLSVDLFSPVSEVPALHNYRLIHESPTNVAGEGSDLRYVKTFEYVKGAHIKGEGIIELQLITDQGREFTYKQRSTDGEFVVPYSTTGDNYGTKVPGDYRIQGTDKTFSVSEDAVLNGLYIN
ncbi:MAG: oligosaccharyl transferase, archaeosortase A system-associated [Methanomicrobiaceae archaeon]|nr:oligosaccharyl transferase, archaeosortase A system-associated [Methanomicrobiaceae archaeon]